MTMTNQEVFDAVWTHAQKKEKSQSLTAINEVSNPNGCLYRGPNGAKCFAGALLPDNEYTPGAEGKAIDVFPWFRENIQNMDLVVDLQSVHDNFDPLDWNRELERVAIQWKLNIPGAN